MSIITDRSMQSKATGRDRWLTEDAPRGHGRFVARITPKNERMLYFRYTNPVGGRVYIPLGAYDQLGQTGLTLQQGRAKAGELSRLYQSGITDLKGHFEVEKKHAEAERAVELARIEASRVAMEREATRLTVRGLFERWAMVDLLRRKDEGAEVRRMFEKDVLPLIGDILVEDARKKDITAVTDALLARGVTRMAKMIFSLMRQMFRFAVDREIIEMDPTSSIRKSNIGGKDVERDRVLSEDEIKQLRQRLPGARLSPSSSAAIWIALSTCCRIGELLGARWDHIDFEAHTWRIPPDHTKNGNEHTVFLSEFTVEQFKALKVLSDEAAGRAREKKLSVKAAQWVYPNRTGTGPVCPKTVTKQIGDRQRVEKAVMSNRAKGDRSLALVLPGGRWTPHDLRRTGATMMVALGVLPEVAERCLNHTEENKVKRIYQRHSYAKEQREAWALLGQRLDLLVRADAGNVLTLNQRGAA